MGFPKITIITPSFNQAAFIEQTIISVLSQKYQNLEYIIIDGGSKDGSVDIIRRYEKQLAYWCSEPDQGQSDAINKGLKLATGDVVNWLNSDDYLEPTSLQYIGQVFSDTSIKVLCGRSRKFNTQSEFFSKGTDVYEGNLPKTIGWARIDQPETFFRRKAFNDLGDTATGLHYLMDREWWIRYLLKFGLEGIKKSEQVLVNFRLHEQSKTVSHSDKFQIDHDTIFGSLAEAYGLDYFFTLIKNSFKMLPTYKFPYTSAPIDLVIKTIHYYLLHRAHEMYYAGNHENARYLLRHISKSKIEANDIPLYHRLLFRSNPVISPFIKGLALWRQK